MREMFSQRLAPPERNYMVYGKTRKAGTQRSDEHNKGELASIREREENNKVHIKEWTVIRNHGKKEIKYPENCYTHYDTLYALLLNLQKLYSYRY